MGTMTGKTVLITGATAGIGLETARALAIDGASVFIVGRNAEKTQGVVQTLKTETGNQAIDSFIADLSVMAEVRRLAAEVLTRIDRLDVNNAGALFVNPEKSKDGFELTFATNHLSPFLLTHLLLPALERAAPSRVVTVASEAHRSQRIDFGDLMTEPYSNFKAYGRSKLANILFSRELARRLEGKRITSNSLHPGVVASNFLAKPGIWGVIGKISSLFMISSTDGAKTSVYLASSKDVEGVSGKYFDKCRERIPNEQAQDDRAAQRLWAESEKMTGLNAPA